MSELLESPEPGESCSWASTCFLYFSVSGFLKGIYKGSIKGLGFRVSEKLGVPYFGVRIIRILLFRVVPYFRKLPFWLVVNR